MKEQRERYLWLENLLVRTYFYPNERKREVVFLREFVTPICEVLLKQSRRNKGGKTSHAAWRNYGNLINIFGINIVLRWDGQWTVKQIFLIIPRSQSQQIRQIRSFSDQTKHVKEKG